MYDWLEDAHQKNQKVIFITIGSECGWEPWSIDAMKKGLIYLHEKYKVRAIWALPGLGKIPHPFEKDDDKFIVSSWLAQNEILNHPAVQLGLTHCGFGGTTEFIMAGIPLLLYPHTGD